MPARNILAFLFPGGVLFALTLFWITPERVVGWDVDTIEAAPYVVWIACLLMAWRFNRSRLAFATIALALADRFLRHFCLYAPMDEQPVRLVYQTAFLLIPVNLALFAMMKERGLFSVNGLVRVSLIALQPFIVFLFYVRSKRTMTAIYAEDGFAGFIYLVAFLVIVYACVRRRETFHHGLFWSLTLCLAALGGGDITEATLLQLSGAALILLASALEASHSMAYRDELTGLPARRALREALIRLGNRYAIAMIDIDHFKKFNDRYGHDVGDQVLRMVATQLARIKGGGKVYRYGGEEFTVVFPGKTTKEVIPHLEQARKELADTTFVLRGWNRPKEAPTEQRATRKKPSRKLQITISAGAAEVSDRNPEPEDVIKAADKALYRAKKGGRNQVRPKR